MPRIRSIHPGFFTDEDIVECSFAARLLLIGLGVQSDDKGVFPWKPTMLKMRIFPGDSIDVTPLLSELLDCGLIARFDAKVMQDDAHQKPFGAIKSFRAHQKPKSPNDLYPASEEILKFVGLGGIAKDESEENETPQTASDTENDARETASFLQKGENPPQMEEGIGVVELGKPNSCPFPDFWSVWPNKVSKAAAQKSFKRLKPELQRAAIDNAADWFQRWQLRNPQASPIHATTYLNNRRWEDDQTPLKAIMGGGMAKPFKATDALKDMRKRGEI